MRSFTRRLALAAAIAVTAVASTAQAQFTIYTDRTAFQSALFSFVVESFDAGTVSAPGLSLHHSSAGSVACAAPAVCHFADRVVHAGAETQWNVGGFLFPVNAFGGNWDLAPGGEGQGIRFFVTPVGGGSEVLVSGEVPNSHAGGFWGFIATSGFQSVRYDGGTQGGSAETHNLEDLTFGVSRASVTTTPEPASVLLVAGGLVAMVGVARRRRSA
jgi:hypothetical protein